MLFFTIIAAAVFVYLLQYFVYKKYAFHALRYQVSLQLPEVFEGEELYLYEEIEADRRVVITSRDDMQSAIDEIRAAASHSAG